MLGLNLKVRNRLPKWSEIWSRWKGLAETIMTIPKFKSVWEKTKDVHASEFRDFLDSFYNMYPTV
jgi:hypothetical protein